MNDFNLAARIKRGMDRARREPLVPGGLLVGAATVKDDTFRWVLGGLLALWLLTDPPPPEPKGQPEANGTRPGPGGNNEIGFKGGQPPGQVMTVIVGLNDDGDGQDAPVSTQGDAGGASSPQGVNPDGSGVSDSTYRLSAGPRGINQMPGITD